MLGYWSYATHKKTFLYFVKTRTTRLNTNITINKKKYIPIYSKIHKNLKQLTPIWIWSLNEPNPSFSKIRQQGCMHEKLTKVLKLKLWQEPWLTPLYSFPNHGSCHTRCMQKTEKYNRTDGWGMTRSFKAHNSSHTHPFKGKKRKARGTHIHTPLKITVMNETVASLQLVAKTNKNARPRQEQKQVFFIKKKNNQQTPALKYCKEGETKTYTCKSCLFWMPKMTYQPMGKASTFSLLVTNRKTPSLSFLLSLFWSSMFLPFLFFRFSLFFFSASALSFLSFFCVFPRFSQGLPVTPGWKKAPSFASPLCFWSLSPSPFLLFLFRPLPLFFSVTLFLWRLSQSKRWTPALCVFPFSLLLPASLAFFFLSLLVPLPLVLPPSPLFFLSLLPPLGQQPRLLYSLYMALFRKQILH